MKDFLWSELLARPDCVLLLAWITSRGIPVRKKLGRLIVNKEELLDWLSYARASRRTMKSKAHFAIEKAIKSLELLEAVKGGEIDES